MKNIKRAEQKYQRRKFKRQLKKQQRSDALGTFEEVMSFDNLYKCGKECCKGVRWKSTTQAFELFLLERTAKVHKQLMKRIWKPHKRHRFKLSERGKVRDIEAPCISDRQVDKVVTRNVLLPLYTPQMIYNNGASLRGKGFKFSVNELKEDLRKHFRNYQQQGWVILIDFKGFFPNANHLELYKRHSELILNPDFQTLADKIVFAGGQNGIGMPLGVEPSQAEMIALPSSVDNYIKCQLRMKAAGHYMDDYYIIVPPDRDPKLILEQVLSKAEEDKFVINRDKFKIVPLTKPFRYCKAKYLLTDTGKVVLRGSRTSKKQSRKQVKKLYKFVQEKKITLEDVWSSISGRYNYFDNYNDHAFQLKLSRLFYHIFGFSCTDINNFRRGQTL